LLNKHWRGVASAASRIGWHQQHLRCGLLRFRPDGRVLLFRQKDETICADVRPLLRRDSFAPVPWCGYAPTRHPWRNGARPASMPVAPHHDTSTQPPDARLAVSARSLYGKSNANPRCGFFCLSHRNLGQVNNAGLKGDDNCDLWTAERRCCAVGDSARMPS